MSQANLTLRDVRDSINSGHFRRTAGSYASQRFHALREWTENHRTEIGLALIITGVAIAVLCSGASIFAFIIGAKLTAILNSPLWVTGHAYILAESLEAVCDTLNIIQIVGAVSAVAVGVGLAISGAIIRADAEDERQLQEKA